MKFFSCIGEPWGSLTPPPWTHTKLQNHFKAKIAFSQTKISGDAAIITHVVAKSGITFCPFFWGGGGQDPKVVFSTFFGTLPLINKSIKKVIFELYSLI